MLSTICFSAESDDLVILPVISLCLAAIWLFFNADGFGLDYGAPFSFPSSTAILLSLCMMTFLSRCLLVTSSLYFYST